MFRPRGTQQDNHEFAITINVVGSAAVADDADAAAAAADPPVRRDGTRTHNLRIRSQTPNPLGHAEAATTPLLLSLPAFRCHNRE